MNELMAVVEKFPMVPEDVRVIQVLLSSLEESENPGSLFEIHQRSLFENFHGALAKVDCHLADMGSNISISKMILEKMLSVKISQAMVTQGGFIIRMKTRELFTPSESNDDFIFLTIHLTTPYSASHFDAQEGILAATGMDFMTCANESIQFYRKEIHPKPLANDTFQCVLDPRGDEFKFYIHQSEASKQFLATGGLIYSE